MAPLARAPPAATSASSASISRGCRSLHSRAYIPTTIVRDAHQLAELLGGRFGDRDVVAERLAHLLDAVGADEQRHGEDGLRLLAAGALKFPPDQVVERLVGAAELDVGANFDRVDALQQRVEELGQADRLPAGEAAGEVVALKQLGDGDLPGVAEDVGEPHRRQPVGVVDDLGALGVEDAHQLVEVAARVRDDVLRALRGPGGGAPGRVADLAGEAADDEHRRMPEVLELAQLAQHDGVAEGQLGAGGVDAQFDPQRALFAVRGAQPFGQAVGGQDLRGAGGEDFVCLAKLGGQVAGRRGAATSRPRRR